MGIGSFFIFSNSMLAIDLGLDYRRIHDVEIIRFVHSLDFMLLQSVVTAILSHLFLPH